MKSRFALLVAGLIFLTGGSESWAQFTRPMITIKGGVLGYQMDFTQRDQHEKAPLVEAEARWRLRPAEAHHILPVIGPYLGFWEDDGKAINCRDCVIYAHRILVAGARAGLQWEAIPMLPIALSAGMARHFIYAEPVAGGGFGGDFAKAHRDAFISTEAVVRVGLRLHRRIELMSEYQLVFPIGDQGFLREDENRTAVKFGMSFFP